MKKILSVSVVMIILALVMSGCEKIEPPPAPPVTYSISISISGEGLVTSDKMTGLSVGSSAVLKFTPKSGYSLYSVKLNGTKVEEIVPTDKEVSYTVQAINKNIVVEAVFVETNILIFSVKSTDEQPWYLTAVNAHKASDRSYIRNVPLDPWQKTDRYYNLYPSMEVVVLEEDGGVRKGTWSLKQTVLTIDGHNYPLLELTPKKFSYQSETVWSNFEQFNIFYILTFERK